MQVFAVFKAADPARVKANIEKHYGNDHYDAGGGVFFVATEGETTRQLATKIGLGDESAEGATSGIVMPVTTYWGRHDPELWEWIGIKQNAVGGAQRTPAPGGRGYAGAS